MISLDTETTSLDHWHGARPFMVQALADGEEEPSVWRWDVDPLTRQVAMPADEVGQIRALLEAHDWRVCWHNGKFDAHMLVAAGIISVGEAGRMLLECDDTILMDHILGADQLHNLTAVTRRWLDHDIQPLEESVKEATVAARKVAKDCFPEWRVAREGDPMMPSVRATNQKAENKKWKNDMWLPWAVCEAMALQEDHPWRTVTSDYGAADAVVTRALREVMLAEIDRLGLRRIYRERVRVLPAAFRMEHRRINCIVSHTGQLKAKFSAEAEKCREVCRRLSGGTLDKLPLNGKSNALEEVVKGRFGLVSTKTTKAGNDSMDKDVVEEWLNQTEPTSDSHQFLLHLQYYRKRQTALGFIDSYQRHWLPDEDRRNSRLLATTYNVTGTRLLRGSMSNPNGQQISKQALVEMGQVHGDRNPKRTKNARWMFGPGPGREWWSMDGRNLELRIPAYYFDETDLIWIFEHPDEPPYYGSYHLVVCDVLYPDLFAEHGKSFKEVFEDTLYQWVKNGNFARQYGAQKRKADATYRFAGATELIGDRFPRIEEGSRRMKELANRTGGVSTIPDRTVDPTRGYPLPCKKSYREDGSYGGVMPTTPLSYLIQGTAGWWINKAMIRTDDQLEQWREAGWDGFVTLQVHDELVFDVPRGIGPEPWKTNLPRMRKIRSLMEEGGAGISVPTPCSMEWHGESWASGMAL